MTLSRSVLLTLCLALSTGCSSGPLGGMFARKERTTYQTPRLRMEEAVAVGKQATGQDTPEQQQLVVDLARKIQTEPDPLVRCSLVEAAGEYNTPLATQVLRAALQDSDPLVRVKSCKTIGQRGEASHVSALAEVVRADTNADVQIEAVRALGKLQSPETPAALTPALESDDPAMQFTAVQAMKRSTGQDLGGDVRAYLAAAKGEAPPRESAPEVASRFGRWLPW